MRAALAEDIRAGDITTEATVPPDLRAEAEMTAKQAGVIAGLEVAALVFSLLDTAVEFIPRVGEGEAVEPGRCVAEVRGPARAILTGERVALNFLQHLSGVATRTRRFVELVAGTGAAITDTRKTTPGLRLLEKYAVRVGGGQNHRYALDDAILIKDNHIAAAGGIRAAVERARRRGGHTTVIEVEPKPRAGGRGAGRRGGIIMLDNMSPAAMRECVALIAGRAVTEASGVSMRRRSAPSPRRGGSDLHRRAHHSVTALDISLNIRAA